MSAQGPSSQLQSGVTTSIAQLNPELSDINSRVIRGAITITWPFSSYRNVAAFVLAEIDFKLRRDKGQVRVEFSGPAAKAIADAGLNSGDEITLSLNGVEWADKDPRAPLSGEQLDWQLKFHIDVSDSDPPALPEPEPTPAPPTPASDPKDTTPLPETTAATNGDFLSVGLTPAKRPANDTLLESSEYASPAFLKRARVSYGSLFEGGMDTFEEDMAGTGRERKRPRFSTSWRYTSRSPSPSPERPSTRDGGDVSMVDDGTSVPSPRLRPAMVDGGCQTDELDFTPPRQVSVAAEARFSHPSLSVFHTPSKQPSNDAFTSRHAVTPFDSPQVFSGRAPNEAPVESAASQSFLVPAFAKPSSRLSSVHSEQSPQAPRSTNEAQNHLASMPHHEPQHTGHSPSIGFGTSHFSSQAFTPSNQLPLSEDMSLADRQPQSEQNIQHGRRHTILVDHIAEPEQPSWGQVSASFADSNIPKEAKPIETPIRSPQEDGALPVNEGDIPEVVDEQSSSEHDESVSEPADAALEGDEIPEDRGGPEENFGSQTYAEKRFLTGDINQTVSGDGEHMTVPAGADVFVEDARRDAGGDYDITHYSNLSNVQDDDDGSDVESDYSQQDEGHIFDPYGRGNEDDQIDEDVEQFGDGSGEDEGGYEDYESYYEDESEEEDGAAAAPAPAARGPPQVISLLSDSEDEDEEPPAPRVAAPTRDPRFSQFDGSSDDIRDSVPERAGESEGTEGEEVEEGEADHGGEQVDEEELEAEEVSGRKEGLPAEETREQRAVDEKRADEQRADEQRADEQRTDEQRTDEQRADEHQVGEAVEDAGSADKPDEPTVVTSEASIERARQGSSENVDQSPSPAQPREPSPRPETTAFHTAESSPRQDEHLEIMSPIQPSQALKLIRTEEHLTVASTTSAPATDSDVSMRQSSHTVTTRYTDAIAAVSVVEEASEVVVKETRMASEASAASQVDEMDAVNAQLLAESDTVYSRDMPGLQVREGEATQEDIEMKDADEGDQTKSRSNSPTEHATPPPSQHKQDAAMDTTTDKSTREVEEKSKVSDKDEKAHLPTPVATQPVHESTISHGEADVSNGTDGQDSGKAAEDDLPNRSDGNSQNPEAARADVPKPPAPEEIQEAKTPERDIDRRANTPSPPPSQREGRKSNGSSPPLSEATTSFSRDDRGIDETAAAKPRSTRRRGQGKSRAGSKELDPSVQLARASIASRRSTHVPDQTPPENVRITRAASHNHHRSISADLDEDTSVQLAKEALKSPSRAKRGKASEESSSSSAASKVQLVKSMRVDVPDCVTLRMLRYNPGRTVDVMGIVTTEPPEPKRAKGGPRGMMLAFNITDHSVAPTQVTLVHIFRADKTALPIVHPGDAVLLRQFTVAAMQGRGFGLRANDGSSWAVFESGEEEEMPPQIRGPPMELSKGEKTFGALLRTWYENLDEASMAKLRKVNEKVQGTTGAGTAEGERA
ncbi:hypothetical protein ACRALDRAFT_2050861 [Sodiomyces alcalophilus JCM 7366]|uniref:uncharacterized protein n=1 Tax=Sodiomyces alcalophilus JCM 7366 TaxID=591952 RepID=UPI0039B37F16